MRTKMKLSYDERRLAMKCGLTASQARIASAATRLGVSFCSDGSASEEAEYAYNSDADAAHAEIELRKRLRLMGLDHEKLTYFYQGRDQQLTDVHGQNEFTKNLIG